MASFASSYCSLKTLSTAVKHCRISKVSFSSIAIVTWQVCECLSTLWNLCHEVAQVADVFSLRLRLWSTIIRSIAFQIALCFFPNRLFLVPNCVVQSFKIVSSCCAEDALGATSSSDLLLSALLVSIEALVDHLTQITLLNGKLSASEE